MSVWFLLTFLLGICLRPQLKSEFGDRWTFCQTQYSHSEVTGAFVNPG